MLTFISCDYSGAKFRIGTGTGSKGYASSNCLIIIQKIWQFVQQITAKTMDDVILKKMYKNANVDRDFMVIDVKSYELLRTVNFIVVIFGWNFLC